MLRPRAWCSVYGRLLPGKRQQVIGQIYSNTAEHTINIKTKHEQVSREYINQFDAKRFSTDRGWKKIYIYNFVMKLKGAGQMQLAFSSDAHPCFVYIIGAGF